MQKARVTQFNLPFYLQLLKDFQGKIYLYHQPPATSHQNVIEIFVDGDEKEKDLNGFCSTLQDPL